MALTQCSSCNHTNVSAHYQHFAPGINHQWDKSPSEGPSPTGAPHPQPCPNDNLQGPDIPLYPAVYTQCNDCNYVQTSWPVAGV